MIKRVLRLMNASTPRIAISFVGTGNYQETCYRYGDKEVRTSLFPVAVREFFPEYTPLILLTEEARKKYGQALLDAGFTEDQLVEVPSGKEEAELWELFDRIQENIPEGSELVLDITHGFRTQPIILLAVVEFLKSVRNVTVSHIVYGAFEARSPQRKPTVRPAPSGEAKDTEPVETSVVVEAPVWDLRTFLDLMDWAAATRRFLDTGDASLLQRNLKAYHTRTYKEERPERARNLMKLGDRLAELSEAFRLNRAYQFHREASRITDVPTTVAEALKVLEELKEAHEAERIPEAHPLNLLLEDIESMLRSLHYPSDAEGLAYLISREGLCMQASLVEQLLRFGLYQQAITVAREAMVALYMARKLKAPEPDFIERDIAEYALNRRAREYREQTSENPVDILFALWNRIAEVRNDVNHAGMRERPLPAGSLKEQIEGVCCELVKLIQGEVGCHAP